MFKDDRQTHDAHPVHSTTTTDGIELIAGLRPRRSPVRIPEISLVAAIFKDAVHCAQRASRGVTRRQSSEALDWIRSERIDWPFAFLNVCDLLGMDAIAVRTQLRREGDDSGPRSGLADAADRAP